MQISIQVPDNLSAQRIYQRIRELEESLREEAKFISSLSKKTPPDTPSDDPWSNPDAVFPTTDTGIADFALNHDHYLYGTPKQP